jgi:hypothetical protein
MVRSGVVGRQRRFFLCGMHKLVEAYASDFVPAKS